MVEYDIPAMVHVSTSCNACFHTTGAHYLNADTTATGYDKRRRAISVADGLGNTTQSTFDLAGNLTEAKAPNGATVSYAYDSANRLATITQSLDSGQAQATIRSEEHTSELQSHSDLVCRLLLEKKKPHVSTPVTQ